LLTINPNGSKYITFVKKFLLRKALKIKALVLLTAWMMIFAHNVVPHNHQDDCTIGCNQLVHKISPDENGFSNLYKFRSQPEEVRVCHISGFLFQQFSPDNSYFVDESEPGLSPSVISKDNLPPYNQVFVSEPATGSSSLRAPPVA